MVRGTRDKLFEGIIRSLLVLLAVGTLFPLLYVFSVSITPYSEVLKQGGFLIVPRRVTFEAYSAFLEQPLIPSAYAVSAFITVVGTLVNLALTVLMAYPLSKRTLPARNGFLFLVVVTLLFSGGIIPTYLIVKQTGLINSLWAMILPSAVSAFNMLLVKTFFENVPAEMYESAKIDGAGESRILAKIYLPLSKPVLATVGLFYAVGHWNEFFQAIMYINDASKYPLQVVLRRILLASSSKEVIPVEVYLPTETMQMAAVVLTAIPILVVYPFIQKHFTQGMLLGAIKG